MTVLKTPAQQGFYISAAHKSSGKTLLSIGLAAALNVRGLKVQPFKKGPDYIDPLWLGRAAQRPCYNLDFYTQSISQITNLFAKQTSNAQVALVEGNKGLYDGMGVAGQDSNAALVKLLGLPVVLVIDCTGITRGIAPLLLGYQQFDPEVRFAGVILNKVAGERHEQKLHAAVVEYSDLTVLGALPKLPSLGLEERHLGLVPSNEYSEAACLVSAAHQAVEAHVDMGLLLSNSDFVGPAQCDESDSVAASINVKQVAPIKLGVAKDKVFGFHYPDDLDALRHEGVQLHYFDALQDEVLPDVDALFIGGGFPEMHMGELAANVSLQQAVRDFIESNGAVYAECGGLMWLSRNISYGDESNPMVGALPIDIAMHDAPQGRGYARLQVTADHPWFEGPLKSELACHEFHYSTISSVVVDAKLKWAYKVIRGQGADGQYDGLVYRNVLANYCHLRACTDPSWVSAFVSFIQSKKGRQHENH